MRLLNKLTIFFIILIIGIFIIGCKKQAEQDIITPTIEKPAPQVTQPAENATPPITPEEISKQEVISSADTSKTVSGLRCFGTNIEGVVTNIDSTTVTLAKTVKIIINGKVVALPECDKLTLAPGESTYCKDLTGPYSFEAGKLNRMQFNFASRRVIEEVQC